ncbi:uncharacterized protein LOC133553975 [Nerophis ophidion]|uniref:uncharacterized protein LOC133553975 n=1 Tax=Nerophis ophidion TaxID=159077 RepID=UPI002ADF262F|nr:uncharacterized protein LOC133553975 [Nerophis ophidion]
MRAGWIEPNNGIIDTVVGGAPSSCVTGEVLFAAPLSHVEPGIDEKGVLCLRGLVLGFFQEKIDQEEESRSKVQLPGWDRRLSAVQAPSPSVRGCSNSQELAYVVEDQTTKCPDFSCCPARTAPNLCGPSHEWCSILSDSGSGRTVRRVLTACLLSFLALLGSVSIDLGPNFHLLHSTQAAHGQLTSCRTAAILRLLGKLQAARRLLGKDLANVSAWDLCSDAAAGGDGYGLPCNDETSALCQEMARTVGGLLGTGENYTCDLSAVIGGLLDMWGTVEDTLSRARRDSIWRDVLAARLLLTFKELNHRLMDVPHVLDLPDFQDRWGFLLKHLSFAALMTEQLNDCWLENIDRKLNSSRRFKHLLDTDLWEFSPGKDLPGSGLGLQALKDTEHCLFAGAVPALRKASRYLASRLSMKISLLAIACLSYPLVMFSFKQMTEWIHDYARRLKDKTEDLRRQRQLAEDLLHQMLPKSVARQLRRNKHVEAESYEKVTIFFSDIVGFTSISASCTPLQVVGMLNNLYLCFDTRIDSYDVYKVETIGDAYMVASGLPERNGDRHADEIAKMALDLVAAVRQVSIPHMPDQRLQLRAGIHTGPCVAGIVGSKMPRYCLFGDTVNTASRMESTSLPQKIHTSSESYLALTKDNAYELQLRGEIEVKGKGKMKTYWLLGHKNFSVQNDSLVCHWNPNKARKKKKVVASSDVSVGNSSVTVQSLSEKVSLPSNPSPPQAGVSVPGPSGTMGSMSGGLQSCQTSQSRPAVLPDLPDQTCSPARPPRPDLQSCQTSQSRPAVLPDLPDQTCSPARPPRPEAELARRATTSWT